jgi:tetratricopeptide (TPR) repeat protein
MKKMLARILLVLTLIPRDLICRGHGEKKDVDLSIVMMAGIAPMKKVLITLLAYMVLATSVAWGQDAIYYYKRGLESSMADKKIEYFTKALQLNPNLTVAYEKRGLHYYFQRKWDKVIQDYAKVVEQRPDWAESYRMLSLAYLKTGRVDEAIAYASRAIELDPLLASAYSYRAEASRLKGRAAEALRDSTKAIQLRGDDRTTARAYKTRAQAHQQLGHGELSAADFNKSFELDPRYAIYRYLASTASLEEIRGMGLFGIIALILVGIFQLSLRAPKKTDLR